MIRFDTLEASQDGKILNIKAVVPDSSYYSDVYINELYIHTQDTYNPADMTSNYVYKHTANSNTKELNLTIAVDQLNLQTLNNLYIVYVNTSGSPAPDTPCGLDEVGSVGAIVNFYPIYEILMSCINQLDSPCGIYSGFINLFMGYEAFKLCLYTGDYQEAIKRFNRFFDTLNNNPNKKRCCYG